MLIDFSVSNFRSFRDEQTLSMVAAPRLKKRDNVLGAGVDGEKFPDLLKVAVIYGPNASGKSNLLRAMAVVGQIAEREPTTSDLPLPVTPFCFDAELADRPSLFRLHFVLDGVRYQYHLGATKKRIVSEKLVGFFKGRESLFYERVFDSGEYFYQFGPRLKEDLSADLLNTWRQLTPPKLLFIAQAVANSSEHVSVLRKPFGWLKDCSRVLMDGMSRMANASQNLAGRSDFHADGIAAFLREVDVPISKIRIEPSVSPLAALAALGVQADGKNEAKGARPRGRTLLTHKTALGEAELSFEDQSEGTKNLIGFWLPWVIKEDGINESHLLIVDELDSSLHPSIVATLVEKHIKSTSNSQLIFSTHDTHLMDTKLLRRDQFWLTERDGNGATRLTSIYDYEGREGEDLEKRYYEGRYRALPVIRRR
jgi:energy-coupling factor transporter ATP-binding protein EcfA2